MRTIIITILMGFGSIAIAEEKVDQWFCRDESGKRDGNVLWACGVGESTGEATARAQALENAFNEYHVICAESADCDKNKVTVEPKRLTCTETFGGRLWKCYRLIEIVFHKKDLKTQ